MDFPAQIGPYKNRIKDVRIMAVKDLLENPHNWRLHPQAQQDGLDAIMRQVGVIDVVRWNEPTGRLFDGHLRKKLFASDPDAQVVVLVTDMNESEEAAALATFDALTGLAGIDEAKLKRLLTSAEVTEVMGDDAAALSLLGAIGDHYEVDLSDEPAEDPSDGSLLELAQVTIADPRHTVESGDIWQMGQHVLICADVHTDWPLWKEFLTENRLFVPYSGPFAVLNEKAEERPLLLVQPDTYLCGHMLDQYENVTGEAPRKHV
jgi:hypothetical protein